MTEASPLLTPANVIRLRRNWERYWDGNKAIRVEKTPSNLLMTRFLQAAFPASYFIVIKRHPVPVSLATQKWSRSPLHDLFKHWLRCHQIFDEDKKHLKHFYELSYEDYIARPKKYMAEIADFIGTEFSDSLEEQPAEVHNRKYFDCWNQMLEASFFKPYYRSVARKYERRFAPYGYSLATASWPASLGKTKPLRRAVVGMLYLSADLYSVLSRVEFRVAVWADAAARRNCPEKVRAIIRKLKRR